MDVDAGPANNERPKELQATNEGQTVRHHPFVAQTSAVLDQSRTSPSGGLLPHPSLTDLARPALRRTQGSGRKNGAYSDRTKEWILQGKRKREVRGRPLDSGPLI